MPLVRSTPVTSGYASRDSHGTGPARADGLCPVPLRLADAIGEVVPCAGTALRSLLSCRSQVS